MLLVKGKLREALEESAEQLVQALLNTSAFKY